MDEKDIFCLLYTSNKEFFSLAEKQLEAVINSGEYHLERNYEDLWFWFNTANKNGQESIFDPYHTRTSHHQHGQSGKQTV